MANANNLIPNSERTPEERRANAKKAGKASGKARRERKAMKEQMLMLLKLPLKNEKVKEQMKALGLEDIDIDNQMAITLAIYQKALKGDTKAYELIRDTIGEKPADVVNNINMNYEDTLKEAMDESEY